MTQPVSLEEYARQADQSVAEAADQASQDLRNFSLPYISEGKPTGVDWNFVEAKEGKRYLQGYVPADNQGRVIGQSGVTIASGIDLGQHGPSDMKALNLYQGLIDRLTPYMKPTLRGAAAQDFLKKNPVSISDEEARMIDERAQTKRYNDVAGQYNAAVANEYGKNPPRFQGLPQGAQTAITDLAFQYGNLAARTPVFWDQVTTGQWQAAQDNLWNFHDAHEGRRREEAGLLSADIGSGLLPPPSIATGRR